MAITLNAYLNFAGNSRDAMTYYQTIFGGELTILSFGEMGVTELPADGTMHARLATPEFTIMASDAMPGAEKTWGGTRVYLCFGGDEVDRLTGWYEKLASDGKAGMPLEKQVWGDTYGDVMDKFGIEWMFNIAA